MDLDGDGYDDLISGQYNPGIVTWFRGSKEGFLDGVVLREDEDPKADPQWFTAPSFADLDGDGDFDFVVAGGGGIRVNYNVGSKTEPKFGKRELLLDTAGEPLVITPAYEQSAEQIAEMKEMYAKMGRTYFVNPSKEFKSTPDVVDWDGDGILDLLVTDYWMKSKQAGATFFKGVEGGRYEPGKPLFDGKWIPGAAPLLCVTDWNEDGKPDLLVGTSIVTVDGVYSERVNGGLRIARDDNGDPIKPAFEVNQSM